MGEGVERIPGGDVNQQPFQIKRALKILYKKIPGGGGPIFLPKTPSSYSK